MAENKKSFILYADLIHMVDKLPDDKAGELFKLILNYVNDNNPDTDDVLLQVAFEPIKRQLKRDLTHWESIREKRREAGKKGGKQKVANASKRVANQAVNVNDTVNVNVIHDVYKGANHLTISTQEFSKLANEYGTAKAEEYVDKVLNYANNHKYKSLYLTALTWLRKDAKENDKSHLPKFKAI